MKKPATQCGFLFLTDAQTAMLMTFLLSSVHRINLVANRPREVKPVMGIPVD
jgi:hypothetical protein